MLTFEEDFKDIELFFPVINGELSQFLKNGLQQKFRQSGLEITPAHWTVLACLWKQDNITQKALCDTTFIDKPTMTRLIDGMVEQGYVEKNMGIIDRRSNIISLTDKGKDIQMRVNYAVFELIQDAFVDMNNEDVEMLRVFLKKIFKNVLI